MERSASARTCLRKTSMNAVMTKQPAKGCRDGVGDVDTLAVDTCHQPEHQQGGRNAAGSKTADNAPVDPAVHAVNSRSGRLGDRGVEQIGSDGRGRMNAEEQAPARASSVIRRRRR